MRKASFTNNVPALLAGLILVFAFFGIGLLPIKSYPTTTTPANAVYTQGTNFFAGTGVLPIANGGTGSTSGIAVLNSYSTVTISAAGTTTLSATSNVNAKNVAISAGSGAYTASIVLSDTSVPTGALYDVYFNIPASTNPTINVYDGSTGGTLLNTVATNGQAGNTTISYFFNGTGWVRFGKGALLTYQNLADLTSASIARANLGLGTASLISSTAGGDLSGTLPNPTVIKLNGTLLSGLPTGLFWWTSGAPSQATANNIASILTGTTGTLNLGSATVTLPSLALASGTTATTQTAGDTSTKVATDNFVSTSFAPLASPTFTGTPSLPTGTTGVTQTAGDASTKLATDNFVSTSFAPLASPVFVGTPTAPTQTSGDNTAKIATDQFVQTAVAAGGGGGGGLTGFRNRLINGDFKVNQRGTTSVTSTIAYVGPDRWYSQATGANVTLAQATGLGSGIQYGAQFTGAASNSGIVYGQKIEAANIFDLAGSSTVVLSASLASTSISTVNWTAYTATAGTDNWGSRSSIASGSFTITSTFARYTVSFAFSGDTNGVSIEFTTGALAAGNTLTFANVQLESGSTATTFEKLPINIQTGLCERYFCQFGGATLGWFYEQYGVGTNPSQNFLSFHNTMRAAPTYALVGTITYSNCSTLTTTATTIYGATMQVIGTSTGQTQCYTANSSSYLTFSAEL